MKTTVFSKVAVSALAALLCLSACTGHEIEPTDGTEPLEVKVGVGATETRALVEGTALPDLAEIGVSLVNENETAYDGKKYSNIQFTASGEKALQSWVPGSAIKLSATSGKAYAYYPYSPSVTDITKIPVSTHGQEDYMYANPVTGLSSTNPTANFSMNHALSAVRIAVKQGTYTGTGAVTAVSVKGTPAATSASLNGVTGALSGISGSDIEISVSKSFTISTTANNTDIIVIPTGTSGVLTLSVNLDGKTYSVQTTSLALERNNIYVYTLTVDATGLTLGGVTVGQWGYNNSGNPVIDLGYKVTIAGELSDIAIQNSVSSGVLTVKAVALSEGYVVKEATSTGTATISQSSSGSVRTITVSGLKSDVTLAFNGTRASQGVFAVASDGSLEDYTAVTGDKSSYKGVAVVKGEHKFMIQRDFEDKGYYWGSTNNVTGLEDIKTVDGTPDRLNGYLAGSSSPQLEKDFTKWTAGALADFDGEGNTAKILASGYSNGDEDMGKMLSTYRSDKSDNNWYIPVCGQLALISQNLAEINQALEAIEANQLNTLVGYWSSAEYDDFGAWHAAFEYGLVGVDFKDFAYYRVVLVQDL